MNVPVLHIVLVPYYVNLISKNERIIDENIRLNQVPGSLQRIVV
jgi:hypothetical protein